jgi:hypothetical protein
MVFSLVHGLALHSLLGKPHRQPHLAGPMQGYVSDTDWMGGPFAGGKGWV